MTTAQKKSPQDIFARVGVVGAGTMGSGIATNLATNGVQVRLIDTTPEAVAAGAKAVQKFCDRQRDKGRMTAEDATAACNRVTTGTDLAALAECDLVIEAVFEELTIKLDLFRRLDAVLPETTVIATNTSALRVSELAQAVRNPSRFLGLHYFNPAAINPVVEVVRGEKTDAEIHRRCLEFCRAAGKKPIACNDAFGFAINRFFIPYGNEAVKLLDEGVGTTAQIDRVARECLKVAAGPFVVINLVKPRIMLHAQQNLSPHGGFYVPAKTLAARGNADYDFEIGDTDAGDAASDAIIADRLRGAVFFPVLQELDEGVASAEDIDMGAEQALRFGNPPCRLMDELGREEAERLVKTVIQGTGHALPDSLQRVGKLRKGA